MPELPDVEGFKQYLDHNMLNKTIQQVHVTDERILDDISKSTVYRHLKNEKIDQTQRHGKYLFAHTTGKKTIVFHFGMTGYFEIFHNDSEPNNARVIFDLTDKDHLAFVCQRLFGDLTLTDNIESFIKEKDLGPDALDDNIDEEWFKDALNKKNSMIKSVLMDQSFLSGIGNVYSDEILFQERIHPKASNDDLTEKQQTQLFKQMRKILKTASKKGGDPDQLPDDFLIPHRIGHGDEQCPECKGTIEKIKVSGRTAQYCPNCQEK